jgi:hypothetical protein
MIMTGYDDDDDGDDDDDNDERITTKWHAYKEHGIYNILKIRKNSHENVDVI